MDAVITPIHGYKIREFPEIWDSTIRANEITLTLERLHEVLEYNGETGLFRWKIRSSNRCKKGWFNGSGGHDYPRITIDKKTYFAHRIAYFYTYSEWPNQIDHKDHDTKDNKINKIRNVTPTENGWNRRPSGISGIKGVSLHRKTQRYRARITIYGSQITLGYFNTAQEAGWAYEVAARGLQGDLMYQSDQDCTKK